SDLPLEDQIGREVAKLNVPGSGLEQRALRYQPDDLAPRWRNAVRLGFHLHHVVRAVEWRLLDVDEVHGDLRLAIHLEPEALHVPKSARRPSDRLRDFLRDGQVRRGAEVDVV